MNPPTWWKIFLKTSLSNLLIKQAEKNHQGYRTFIQNK